MLSLFRHRNGNRDSGLIALTFDDGPSESTPQVLNILQQYGIRATFFLIPQNIWALPQVAHRIFDEGHEVGAHVAQPPSFSVWNRHALFTKASEENIRTSLGTVQQVLGVRPRLFRPSPELVLNRGTAGLMRKYHLVPVLASAYSRAAKSADEQEKDIIPRLKGGAIALLHDGHDLLIDSLRPEATLGALPWIIEAAMEKGLRFTTVSNLLRTSPYQYPFRA